MNTHFIPIGVDVDGVLADLAGYALTIINRRLRTNYSIHDWVTYNIEDSFDEPVVELFYQMLRNGNFWLAIPPVRGVSTDMRWLVDHRYDVYVITVMTSDMAPFRKRWLEKHNIPYKDLIVVEKPEQKVSVAQDLGLKVFVDDLPATIKQMVKSGIEGYLIRKPWNGYMSPPIIYCEWFEFMKDMADRAGVLRTIRSYVPPADECRLRWLHANG